tara:strand:- start:815 stop:1564 length:750 start_codon:yes stop_codon:yes gene_type:complete
MEAGARLITPATKASLQRHGYAVVHAPAAARHCAAAVAAWATSGSFRYPSISEPSSSTAARASGGAQMDVLYRRAFNELYSLTAECASSVWAGLPAPPTAVRPFAPDAVGTRPFADARARSSPYAGSFCSVFNFDHGFLNEHRDRGLITAIYGRAAGTSDGQVRLWGQRPGGDDEWHALEGVPADAVVLLVGEGLERLSGGGFPAMLHSCRVDPRAERLSMLHRGPHPGAPEDGNRQSIALVLAQEEEP